MDILEREPFLQTLEQSLSRAATGLGCVVFLGGEAGVGKTTLVRQLAQRLRGRARLAVGACDPLSTPRPLGPLSDAATALGLESFGSDAPRLQVFQAVLDRLGSGPRPTVLIIEDAHWADEATLDLLRFIGRRVAETRTLIIVTYRDDESGAGHPLRIVLGDLATSPATRRMTLPPLSEAAVAELAAGHALDAGVLFRRTAGNSFFVTEILASGSTGIPPSVRDAVLARAARLPPSARAVLEAAAVIGARIEPGVLAEVTGAEWEAIETCRAIGVMQSQDDSTHGYVLTFRHELARQAVLEAVPPHRRQVLHRLALQALEAAPSTRAEAARLAHHAEAAGNREAVLKYAPEAARQAAELHAHREAAAQYARALRFAGDLPLAERASLLERFAQECSICDRRADAIVARREAVELWKALNDPLGQGRNFASMMSLHVGLGQTAEAEAVSRAALDLLEALPPSPELALARYAQATMRMFERDIDEAIAESEQAITLADRFEDNVVLTASYNTLGSSLMFVDYERGRENLERALAIALEAQLPVHVANAYSNLGSASGEVHEFLRAEQDLQRGIAFCAKHDMEGPLRYMLSWQAIVQMRLGRWNDAVDLARQVLQYPEGALIQRVMALVALGHVYARQGHVDVWTVLDEALALADRSATLQRVAAVRIARAEAAWLGGQPERAAEEARAVYDDAVRHRHPWFTGELAYWQWKAEKLRGGVPALASRPCALQMEGRWAEAAAAWRTSGCPYEAAVALSESGDPDALKEALRVFEELGARPMAAVVGRHLRDLGVKSLPRGPRASTRAHPAGLTKREVEVLGWMAAGLRNSAIAERMVLSAKTVDHHVSSVLSKLGAKSRTEAVRTAIEMGLLQNREA
ncbi:ATP-binding protein [Deinococcus yavapaiensis]|uniref:LuxR family transcriptional regulator n=1 Tax=Deinococcus yavapaiensis KR-236 TaxID=694435 RepID=A0A318SC02_9DEIO|nr:helix-turn-helix transcriptional regulator [Deinococcus yavapaiensis]PYE53840.1 LuxR family transcriptional regulator [Deinococcus yavapaiensis KR-236]